MHICTAHPENISIERESKVLKEVKYRREIHNVVQLRRPVSDYSLRVHVATCQSNSTITVSINLTAWLDQGPGQRSVLSHIIHRAVAVYLASIAMARQTLILRSYVNNYVCPSGQCVSTPVKC